MTIVHTLETSAAPETIWRIWTAVSRWPEWDSELTQAQIEGDFDQGAVGRLTSRNGVSSKFVISQVNWGKSYTFTTQLLFCELKVRRFLELPEIEGQRLRFTHEVSFAGLLAPIFRRLLGSQFQKVLPDVMKQLRQLAEVDSLGE